MVKKKLIIAGILGVTIGLGVVAAKATTIINGVDTDHFLNSLYVKFSKL